jgi:hypothetical protein
MLYLSRLACVVASSLLAATAGAQTLREEAALLDKPDGAPQGARIKAATPVKLLKRQGFWVEVEAGGRSGWLKVSAVSFAGAAGPVAIDTGRLGTGNIVATSAARGLSAKDLLEGRPNTEEAERLDALAIDPGSVGSFRAQGGVQPVASIGALSAPRTVAAAGAVPGQGGPAGGAAASPSPSAAPAGNSRKKGDDDW